MLACFSTQIEEAVPLSLVTTTDYEKWYGEQTATAQSWLNVNNFKAKAGEFCLLPDAQGQLERVAVGVGDGEDFWCAADLSQRLSKGNYLLDKPSNVIIPSDFAVAWGLGAYQFTRYKKSSADLAALVISDGSELQRVNRIVDAVYTVRDLINTPTEDCSPADLAAYTRQLAEKYQADYQDWIGEQLLQHNFPAIHMVGRASHHEPRLLELNWGDASHPLVTLVGKGVCFDTGGLDLKPSQAMRIMKKDMGGAAHVLGLAQLIMSSQLPLRLRVLIPAVENAVSGRAYRPGDIVRTRQGLTIEIGNTDAEGRVILADALSYACEQSPDVLIDFATLTGAARVALGTDVAVMFTNQDTLADECRQSYRLTRDPLWQLPLYQGYRSLIEGKIADIDNIGSSPYGGAITAALLLQSFVNKDIPWLHFDVMAWNMNKRPGRPEGGEAHALRAVFDFLQRRYQQAEQ